MNHARAWRAIGIATSVIVVSGACFFFYCGEHVWLQPIEAAHVESGKRPEHTSPKVGGETRPRDFSEARTAKSQEEYQTQYNALLDEPPENIWRDWDLVWQRGDRNEISLMTSALGESLRRRGSREVYWEIGDRLYEAGRSIEELLSIVGVMRYAATPEAIEVLLHYLRTAALSADDDPQLQQAHVPEAVVKKARESIRLAASGLRDGGRNWSISPVLEAEWRGMTQETPSADIATVAYGLSALGTEASTRALLVTASGSDNPTVEKRQFARLAISQLDSNDSVPVLKDALRQETTDPEFPWVIVDALISIGSADASRVMADYLKGKPELDEARLVYLEERLERRQFPDESIKVFDYVLDTESFLNPKIKVMFQDLLVTQAKAEGNGRGSSASSLIQ